MERELGFCEVEHVACGSGLERIYRFMQTDEGCNRPHLDLTTCKVLPRAPLGPAQLQASSDEQCGALAAHSSQSWSWHAQCAESVVRFAAQMVRVPSREPRQL